ncbi:MAG: anthranilate synthase component I family protein [Candidatus Nitronauta litoralis]|uniref:Anthranilate synthase component I family protein n=1 Tax=Candidatus Nitronauta litoralis TaxID=2705533 RepID=A0A7T0BZJ7_9BACT|nr:MAG: anthranilate synthase component I family protein [Candidatus Nitronauta litoralis]
MEILPDWNSFLDLRKANSRLPLIAQRKVRNLDPFLLFSELFAGDVGTFLLESGKGPESTARFSFLGESNGNFLRLDENSICSFDSILQKINFDFGENNIPYAPHFWGGWVGFFSYETICFLEPVDLKKNNTDSIPDLFLAETGTLLVYDHQLEILKVILTLKTDTACFQSYSSTIDAMNTLWQRIEKVLEDCPTPKLNSKNPVISSNSPQTDSSQWEYCDSVHKAKKYIEDGDIYQANLAQRFEKPYDGKPSDLYQNLKMVNPSPFGGLFYFPEGALVSSSPERLVKVENGKIETRPIAGTRPRGASHKEDGLLSQELLLNEKERAEHLMLVDLERNDLGRICEYGTVEVTELMNREQYSHVHHIVSNVQGKLKQGTNLKDILTAVFPGGTITGCPKIRCMEIIEELEPVRRGIYCGSMGYIGYGPHLDLNILIRTILLKDGVASFHAGAGIVADSDPDTEYKESLSKAAALVQALT